MPPMETILFLTWHPHFPLEMYTRCEGTLAINLSSMKFSAHALISLLLNSSEAASKQRPPLVIAEKIKDY